MMLDRHRWRIQREEGECSGSISPITWLRTEPQDLEHESQIGDEELNLSKVTGILVCPLIL